jgi:serine/threonine protein kinase
VYLRLVEQRPDIDGRFVDIRRLGEGHFSLVFRARDTTTGNFIAIKILDPDVRESYRRACFVREEEVLRQFVGQPDIVDWVAPRSTFTESIPTTTGLALDIDFEYYALDLASSDLEQMIYTSTTPFTTRIAALRQAVRGVQRLHAANIAHRDLKPSNILVMDDGTARVADLGTARHVSPGLSIAQAYGGPPGDLRYAAPDLMACLHEIDPAYALAADFYTIGAILFETATGELLYQHSFTPRARQAIEALRYVPSPDRPRVYLELARQLDDVDLPSVGGFGHAPRSVSRMVDELCRDLTRIDFRTRLTRFDGIFRRLDAVRLVMSNEDAFRRWRAQRRHMRAQRRNKELRRAELRSMRRQSS